MGSGVGGVRAGEIRLIMKVGRERILVSGVDHLSRQSTAKLKETSMKPRDYQQEAVDVLSEAIDSYDPSHVFGLFSGGHDSLCACHVASRHPRFTGCIHINTGIGIEETRQFVRDTCKQYEWSLKEYEPPVSYEQLVVEQGFPGPAHHWKMYHRLKERCLRELLRDTASPKNRRRKLVFVSGRRKQESQRRMVTVDSAIVTGEKNPSPRIVWANPLINWTGSDKDRYIREHSLPRNRVVQLMCMSGECLCGAFAHEGELNEIRLHYPKAAAEIDRIAAEVKKAGKHCVWGTAPPGKKNKPDSRQMELPLCFSCTTKFESGINETA